MLFSCEGLYITMFMFLVGLSAGGLIISSVPKAFGMRGFGGISKVAVWTSICCTVLAIGFVVVDLGQPMRLWELFAYSNLGSPLMWDIIVLATYLILSVVYLWATLRHERGLVSARALRAVSVIAGGVGKNASNGRCLDTFGAAMPRLPAMPRLAKPPGGSNVSVWHAAAYGEKSRRSASLCRPVGWPCRLPPA